MKKKKPEKTKNRDNQLDVLNSELGSFGLEPPKVYRREQKRDTTEQQYVIRNRDSSSQNSKRKKARPNKKIEQLSRDEKIAVQKKKRKLKKNVKQALEIMGVIVALIIIIVILSLTVFFKIDTITIKGSEKYTNAEITAVLPISKEKNLFLCNTDYASEKLTESLPYIYEAKITRKLPSTIVVNVTHPEFVFYVKNNDNSYTYFDDQLKALEINVPKKPKNGIEIKKCAIATATAGNTVTFTNKKLNKDILALMQVVKDLSLKEVTAIYSDNVASNCLVYDNRITIKIGETKAATDRVYAALAAIEKLNESNPTAEGVVTSMGGKQFYFTEEK